MGHTGVYWPQEWDTQGFTNKSGTHRGLLTTRVGHTGVYWQQEWDTQGFADHKSGTDRRLLTTRAEHTAGFTDHRTWIHSVVYWPQQWNNTVRGVYWPQELTLVKKVGDLKLTNAISGTDRTRGTNKSSVQTLANVLPSPLTVELSLSVHTTETNRQVWPTDRCCMTNRQVLCDQETGVVGPDRCSVTNAQVLIDQQTSVVGPTDMCCVRCGYAAIVIICTHHWNQQTGLVWWSRCNYNCLFIPLNQWVHAKQTLITTHNNKFAQSHKLLSQATIV